MDARCTGEHEGVGLEGVVGAGGGVCRNLEMICSGGISVWVGGVVTVGVPG